MCKCVNAVKKIVKYVINQTLDIVTIFLIFDSKHTEYMKNYYFN